ncbi:MAG: alpha/beta fold hydrolase [Candidatus Thorarchaeota archaeon]
MNWEEAGNPKNRTIILVHGAGGSAATWFQQLKGLSKNHHIAALELNGHGKSTDRAEKDVTNSYLEDLEKVVSYYERPILGGHSMGGALTQLFALRHPERLSGIILIGTGARLRVNPMVFGMLDNDFEGYIEALGSFMFHEEVPKEIVIASRKEARKCPIRIIRRDFELCNEFDIMQSVSNISTPTLIIVGENDIMTPVKYANYLHANIENSSIHVVKSAGHMVMLEQASIVNLVITDWVRKLPKD